MSKINYLEILENTNNTIQKLKLDDIQKLNELSSYLVTMKQPIVLSEEGTIEFYTFRAIQNISLCIDNCRDEYLSKKITLQEIENKIKRNWKRDYNKF